MREKDTKTKVASTYIYSEADPKCAVSIQTTLTGILADDMRRNYNFLGQKEIGNSLKTYYAGIFGNLKESCPFVLTDDLDNNEFTTIANYQIENVWKTEKDQKVFNFFSQEIVSALNFNVDPSRKTPLKLQYPLHIIEDIELFPLEGNVNQEEWRVNHENDELKFKKSVSTSDNKINIHFEFMTKKGFVPPEALSSYRNLVDKIGGEIFMVISIPLEKKSWLDVNENKQYQNDYLSGPLNQELGDVFTSSPKYNELLNTKYEPELEPHNQGKFGSVISYVMLMVVFIGYGWIAIMLAKKTKLIGVANEMV